MSNNFEEQEEEFRQSGGGWWIKWIGIIVYIAIIIAYAFQTMELVGWLFPADTWFMRTVTVFVCDGCATGYAMAEMFYRFRLRKSKTLVFGMWIVTFILSTLASVIQMYLSSTHNIPHSIDPTVISVAYGVVIAAFVVNIVAITIVIRMEHSASQPVQRYLDDNKPRKKTGWPSRQDVQQRGAPSIFDKHPDGYGTALRNWQEAQVSPVTQPERMYDADDMKRYTAESVDRVAAHYENELKKLREANSPLASPPLTTGDQQGQNGHSH